MLRNSKFKTFVWYTGVGVLVLFAVAVTVFRLMFSSVEEYRGQLEALAGSYLGQPVTISGMDARVVGLSPSVILSDVALLHKGGEQLLTRFDSIAIALDPVASLRALGPVVELTVSGANLEVTRKRDGSFSVQGLELAAQPPQGKSDETAQGALEAGKVLGGWFLGQNRLALRDSHFTLHNEANAERFSFDKVDVELRNDGERHRLNGFVHLPESIGRELRVAVDIKGDPLQQKGWGGGIYVKTVALRPRQWLSQLSWQGSSLQDGILDLELWSHWEGGALESVDTRLHSSNLLLARGESRQAIPQLTTDAHLKRLEGGWGLDLSGLQLQLAGGKVLPMRLALSYRDSETIVLADQLSLQAIAALLPFLPPLDERMQEMVRQMAPSGVVRGVRLRHGAGQPIEVQGRVKGLVLQSWERLPGVSNLDAQFTFNGEQGELWLDSEEGELTLPRLFRGPLPVQHLQGHLMLQRDGEGWQLFTQQLALSNRDLDAELGLALQLQPGSAPWLSLQGRYSAADARRVPRYLPAGIMKENSLHWLDNAFKAGQVPRGTLQYHGFLHQFPFTEHQGRFEVLFDAKGVGLHYHDDWPELRELAGEVHFDGLAMHIATTGGRLFGARMEAGVVTIDNLHAARLLVDSGVQLTIADGLRFLRESPLSKHTGKLLETLRGNGDARLTLQLAIPISSQLQERWPLAVNGTVDFSDDRLDIIDGVSVRHLGGRLAFTEKSFSADALTAELYGRPLTLMIMTDGGEQSGHVVVAGRGRADAPALREAFQFPLFDYLQGEAEWQASVTLPRAAAVDGVVLRISSNLNGVSSKLPHPLAKEAAISSEMQLAFYLSGERSGESELRVGDNFAMAWRQGGSANERGLRRLSLILGNEGELVLPSRDVIELKGSAEGIVTSEWREVLQQLRGEASDAARPLPVVVAMKRLQLLSGTDAKGEGGDLKVADVPELSFNVEQFSFDDLTLGKVALRLLPQGEQLALKDIALESDIFTLSGDGTWTERGNTLFSLNLNAPSLGGMMKHLGFASVIRGGKAKSSGKVWWAGSPLDASLAGLGGQLTINIEDGSIIDVDPGAGRLLGILSIPALPRRLFLDFSDVFKEGLAFSKIQGDIRMEEGHAYTSNLRIESVPANILVSGRTGLAAQDFDQEMYVVPNVSDTVSVASALAWGPQVAAVVALLQEIFKSDIKAATMSRYHISGEWRAPVIQRIVEQVESSNKDDNPYFIE